MVTDLDEKAKQILFKLDELENGRIGFVVKQSYYTYLEDYLKDDILPDQIVLPSAAGITEPVLLELNRQMVELQMQARSLSFNSKVENPMAQNMSERINDLRQSILQSLTNLRSTDAIAVNQLDKQISALENQLSVLPKAERQFITIQRSYRLGENLYVFLTQKRSEAAISEASTVSDVIRSGELLGWIT